MSIYLFIDRKTKQLVRYHNNKDQYDEVIEKMPKRLKIGAILEGMHIYFANTMNDNCVTYQYWRSKNK